MMASRCISQSKCTDCERRRFCTKANTTLDDSASPNCGILIVSLRTFARKSPLPRLYLLNFPLPRLYSLNFPLPRLYSLNFPLPRLCSPYFDYQRSLCALGMRESLKYARIAGYQFFSYCVIHSAVSM